MTGEMRSRTVAVRHALECECAAAQKHSSWSRAFGHLHEEARLVDGHCRNAVRASAGMYIGAWPGGGILRMYCVRTVVSSLVR